VTREQLLAQLDRAEAATCTLINQGDMTAIDTLVRLQTVRASLLGTNPKEPNPCPPHAPSKEPE
jgi:hypothetical protein